MSLSVNRHTSRHISWYLLHTVSECPVNDISHLNVNLVHTELTEHRFSTYSTEKNMFTIPFSQIAISNGEKRSWLTFLNFKVRIFCEIQHPCKDWSLLSTKTPSASPTTVSVRSALRHKWWDLFHYRTRTITVVNMHSLKNHEVSAFTNIIFRGKEFTDSLPNTGRAASIRVRFHSFLHEVGVYVTFLCSEHILVATIQSLQQSVRSDHAQS